MSWTQTESLANLTNAAVIYSATKYKWLHLLQASVHKMHLIDKLFTYKKPILIKFTLIRLVVRPLYTNTKNTICLL